MEKNSKILIIVGGPKSKIMPFESVGKGLNLDLTLASFSELNYFSENGKFLLKVGGKYISDFGLIYVRMVGKRIEDATLLANYAKEKGVKIVDRIYEKELLYPSSISKAMEMKKLIDGGLPLPITYYGSLDRISRKAKEEFNFPFVIKSTSGKRGRDAWAPKTEEDLKDIISMLRAREKSGDRFFAQRFIKASQRIRALVIGDKVVGSITQPTKWRRRFIEKVRGDFPEGEKGAIKLGEDLQTLAISAARAVDLDVCGVDILKEDETGKAWVIEANAAPSWKLIEKHCLVNVEKEILNYLQKVVL